MELFNFEFESHDHQRLILWSQALGNQEENRGYDVILPVFLELGFFSQNCKFFGVQLHISGLLPVKETEISFMFTLCFLSLRL